MPTINLTAGCAIGCVYCYGVGYGSHPDEGSVVLYEDTLERLKRELPRKRKAPRSVFFSPSNDIFQPVAEVLDLAHEILDFLLAAGIDVVILTKGQIPDRTLDLLLRYPDRVSMQIGITTLDEGLSKMFKPNAATPRARLEQLDRLIVGGLATRARLDPTIPGATDDTEGLDRLFAALGAAGIDYVAAGFLFLRPRILHTLYADVNDKRLLWRILTTYEDSERLDIRAGKSTTTALPTMVRKESFTRIREIAGRHSIDVAVCACKNPDIATGTCGIGGATPTRALAQKPSQRLLM